MSEYLIEVIFECESGSYKERNPIVKRYYIKPGSSVGIPEPDKAMAEHGCDKTDLVRVEIYRNVRFIR